MRYSDIFRIISSSRKFFISKPLNNCNTITIIIKQLITRKLLDYKNLISQETLF